MRRPKVKWRVVLCGVDNEVQHEDGHEVIPRKLNEHNVTAWKGLHVTPSEVAQEEVQEVIHDTALRLLL